MLCFPENLPGLSVLEPIPNKFSLITCSEIKVFSFSLWLIVSWIFLIQLVVTGNEIQEHLVALVMKSAKREASSFGRCIAISSLAIYIYCQLTHATRHAKVKDAITVLLAVLKVSLFLPFSFFFRLKNCVCVEPRFISYLLVSSSMLDFCVQLVWSAWVVCGFLRVLT